MNPEPHSLRTAYRSADALAYIATLLPTETLAVSPAPALNNEHVQPTIGLHAVTLLDILIRVRQPRRILEIGTSYGYSACALGRSAASYGGTLLSLEKNPRLAAAARDNILSSGLQQTVEILTGDARQIIPALDGVFGLILQDGGKDDYLPLLDPLVNVLEKTGLLVTDDVLFPVMSLPESAARWGKALADYNHALRNHPRLRTVWLPVGDGIALSVRVN